MRDIIVKMIDLLSPPVGEQQTESRNVPKEEETKTVRRSKK